MSTANGINIGKKLCEIFKIPSENVTCISIDVAPNDFVHVTIGRAVTVDEMEGIVEVLKYYHLEDDDRTSHITGKRPNRNF